MKVSILCILLLAAHALASPVREKRENYLADLGNPLVATAMILGYAGIQLGKGTVSFLGSVKDFVLNPVKASQEMTESKLHSLVSYELNLAQDNKLLSDHENNAVRITYDSTWHHPNDYDMKSDKSVDYLKLTGNEAAATEYRKALKEILALKQSGTSNIKCLYKLHGATVEFLVGNGVISNSGGLVLKKLTGQ